MPWTPRIAGETAPLYIAIADAIAADAETGHLAPGTRLPTHRALAAMLGRATAYAAQPRLHEARTNGADHTKTEGRPAGAIVVINS